MIKQSQNEIALGQDILVDPNTDSLTPASISQLDVLSNTNTGIQIPQGNRLHPNNNNLGK